MQRTKKYFHIKVSEIFYEFDLTRFHWEVSHFLLEILGIFVKDFIGFLCRFFEFEFLIAL